MTIKHRLEKLEANKQPEPYDIKDGYLKRFCTEQGIEPFIYTRSPEEVLRDIQAAWIKELDKTAT